MIFRHVVARSVEMAGVGSISSASRQTTTLRWLRRIKSLSDPEASVASPLLVGSQDDPMLESIHAELDSDETFVPQVKPQQQGT